MDKKNPYFMGIFTHTIPIIIIIYYRIYYYYAIAKMCLCGIFFGNRQLPNRDFASERAWL